MSPGKPSHSLFETAVFVWGSNNFSMTRKAKPSASWRRKAASLWKTAVVGRRDSRATECFDQRGESICMAISKTVLALSAAASVLGAAAAAQAATVGTDSVSVTAVSTSGGSQVSSHNGTGSGVLD